MLVFVLVSEDNFGEGSTTTCVMDNVSHNSLDIPIKYELVDMKSRFVLFKWFKLTQLFQRSQEF